MASAPRIFFFFFFNDTATTEIYTLSLHDALPIWIRLEGERVAFFTQEGSRKARNLERDPRVALSLTDFENPYLSAWLRGRVVEKLEGDEALEVIDRLSVKYTGEPFPMRSGIVFLVEIDRSAYFALPFAHTP